MNFEACTFERLAFISFRFGRGAQVRVVARDTDLQKICRSRALARDLRIFCRYFVELYNLLVGRGVF